MRRRRVAAAVAAAATLGFAAGCLGAKPPPLAPRPAASAAQAPAARVLVDINRADRATLKTLTGIGDAEAERIVGGRPYLTKAELVTKRVLPEAVFLALKGEIVARQNLKRPLAAKKVQP